MIERLGISFCDRVAQYVKMSGKERIIQTKGVNFRGQTFTIPDSMRLSSDTVKFAKDKFKVPTQERVNQILSEQGINTKWNNRLYTSDGELAYMGIQDVPIINENNVIFLEELSRMFPRDINQKVNTQFQKRMLYLQDINHSQFPDKQKFLEQFLRDVNDVENMLSNNGKRLYADYTTALYSKKAILQAKYNNPERYKEIMDLIGLYRKGIVPEHNIETFFPEGNFHPLIKTEMQRLLNGEHYFPQLSKLSENEIAKIELGEVFSVGEKMFVKTKNGYEALKIDKTTYERLFPPVERYSVSQNNVGNCGKIASLNAMIKNPTSRIQIYRMYEQTPNGVRVTIPSKGYTQEFNWNDLEKLNTDENVLGSLGHKMLEYTHDIGFLKHIDTNGNPHPMFISNITGVQENEFYKETWWTWRKNKELKSEYINRENNGIYVRNGLAEDSNLNIGETDGHFYSTTDLTRQKWQNPWTGIEEINSFKILPVDGSVHSFNI